MAYELLQIFSMDKNDRIRLNAIKKRWLGRKRFGQWQSGLAEVGNAYKDVKTLIEMVDKLSVQVRDIDDLASAESAVIE